MLVRECVVEDRELRCRPRAVVQNGVNADSVRLRLLDDDFQEAESLTLVFSRDGRSTACTYSGNPILIPDDMMEDIGTIRLTVIARTGEERVVTRRMGIPLLVVESGALHSTYEPDVDSPVDEVEQAIQELKEAMAEAETATANATSAAETASSAAETALNAALRCNSIDCGNGAPSVAGLENDLYIDSLSGDLYKFENV